MKKRIEKLFPAAYDAIENVLEKRYSPNPIPSEFQGYISSFGASVMQMGLLPTLAVYADEGSGAAQDRRLLLETLAFVLYQKQSSSPHEAILPPGDNKKLFETTVKQLDKSQQLELKKHLLDAAIAVKLCLRTFKLAEK